MQSLRCTKSQQLSQNLHWNKIPGDLHGCARLEITALKITDVSHLTLNVLRVFTCTSKVQRALKIDGIWASSLEFMIYLFWSSLGTRSFKSSPGNSHRQPGLRTKARRLREGHWWAVVSSYRLTNFPDFKSSAHSAVASSLTLIQKNSRGAMCTDKAFYFPVFLFLFLFFPFLSPLKTIILISRSGGKTGLHCNCLLMSNWWLMDLPSTEVLPLTSNAWCGACHPPGGDQYSIMEAAGW